MEPPSARQTDTTTSTERFRFNLDDRDTPGEVIDALALERFLDGREPWSRITQLQRVVRGAAQLPAGHDPARVAGATHTSSWLVLGETFALHVRRWQATAQLTVTAVDAATVKAVLDAVTAGACEPPESDADAVRGCFWYLGGGGPVRCERVLAITPWKEIHRNYTATVATALDAVVATRPEKPGGKLLLLHGPPGTGTTSALRALGDAWRT